MPTSEYLKRYRQEHAAEIAAQRKAYRQKHAEEIAAKRKEYSARKKVERDAKKAEDRKKEQDSIAKDMKAEPSIIAAKHNQQYRHSFICGALYRKNCVVIVEKMGDHDSPLRYRIKIVSYSFFRSMKDVNRYCKENKIKFDTPLIDSE